MWMKRFTRPLDFSTALDTVCAPITSVWKNKRLSKIDRVTWVSAAKWTT